MIFPLGGNLNDERNVGGFKVRSRIWSAPRASCKFLVNLRLRLLTDTRDRLYSFLPAAAFDFLWASCENS
jgi:hypothetical protein